MYHKYCARLTGRNKNKKGKEVDVYNLGIREGFPKSLSNFGEGPVADALKCRPGNGKLAC